ncbi:MAG: lipid-A-disaccharide synthase [Candidatus Omnitrophica bacterium]|jgi:lipid-A-disaccharide synthase|nr:lipid-A-disaccharide synthase [Candidatus Omnitrophota bacterium]MDD5660837.1 lipid-A-disaccharide synthase [Candidatus Omnitrophota bacterium]
MGKIKNLFIVCGEPSGDLLAGNLIEAIKKSNPDIKVSAVGGAYLAKNADQIFYNIKGLSVMGIIDALRKLPKFLKLKDLILQKINTDKPDAIILVDFSGFNLRLARAINKLIPCIYYVSPQVWASREGRINNIRKFISKMIVLFKFEEDFYRQHGIAASCLGHPLTDLVKPTFITKNFLENFRITSAKKIIALLPGSRKQEVRQILPLMLKSAQLIHDKIPLTQFIIAKSPNLDTQIYRNECKKFTLDFKIIDGLTSDCLNAAETSIICSGTATLEAAIIGKPFVIVYKTNLLNYLLYRPQIKIPYIGMVNIVAGRKIIPEFIQFGAQPRRIADSIINLMQNSGKANQMKQELETVKASLGQPGASERAAKLILEFLNSR